MLEPKAFYRKLDALLSRIDTGVPDEKLLGEVVQELTEAFGEALSLSAGVLYRGGRGGFTRIANWSRRNQTPGWPLKLSASLPLVKTLSQKHLQFFAAEELRGHAVPRTDEPAGYVGISVGPGPDYLMLFGLGPSWERNILEFYLHTIRHDLNQRLLNLLQQSRLAEAREVQLSLLPPTLPSMPGYDFAAHTLPAEDVGGDFYDFIPVDAHLVGVAVGDASGHGLAAALQARDVVTGLRMGIQGDLKISRVLARLNAVVARSSLSSRFVSVIYCELDRQGSLFYVNAGHPAPIRLDTKGRITRPNVRGLVLGPMPDVSYERGFVGLDKGDFVLLPTDGVLERTDPEGREFGDGALDTLLASRTWKTSQQLLEAVWDAAVEHGERAPWKDDATLVVIRRTEDPYWGT
jgi:sigma-B regulation protein RsbU (phosphoserine phosphatase)